MRRSILVILLASLLLTSHLAGGPFIPIESKLPDNILSLSQIEDVILDVRTDGDHPEIIGLSKEEVRKIILRRLHDAKIPLADKNDKLAPKLLVISVVLTEPKVEEAVAYDLRVSVTQPVRIDGVDKPLRVPTYLITYTGLEHRDDAPNLAPGHLDVLLGRFLRERHLARLGK